MHELGGGGGGGTKREGASQAGSKVGHDPSRYPETVAQPTEPPRRPSRAASLIPLARTLSAGFSFFLFYFYFLLFIFIFFQAPKPAGQYLRHCARGREEPHLGPLLRSHEGDQPSTDERSGPKRLSGAHSRIPNRGGHCHTSRGRLRPQLVPNPLYTMFFPVRAYLRSSLLYRRGTGRDQQ